MNEIINKKNNKSVQSSIFKVDGLEISDPTDIANRFCNYFTNIGSNLAKKVSSCSTSFKAFLTGTFSDSIFLNPVDESEIIRIAKTFGNGKATGYDGIPMSIIKQCIDIVSTPLAHIINLSINGIVPDEMKIARVIPLYNSGDRELIVNYRPVSILPSFSKFFERVIYNRLLNYIDKHEILCNSQYRFRKQHSTTLALINMYDKISSSIDQRKCSVGVFLDLSKAFDTVNHDILLNKLDYYGIRGLSLDWFKSYLTNRSQFVEFNGASSSSKFISCGVPQGSIVGPLLFLLYINDLSKVSDLVEICCLQMIPTFFVRKKICILYRLC